MRARDWIGLVMAETHTQLGGRDNLEQPTFGNYWLGPFVDMPPRRDEKVEVGVLERIGDIHSASIFQDLQIWLRAPTSIERDDLTT